jgi:hypothetical protein
VRGQRVNHRSIFRRDAGHLRTEELIRRPRRAAMNLAIDRRHEAITRTLVNFP